MSIRQLRDVTLELLKGIITNYELIFGNKFEGKYNVLHTQKVPNRIIPILLMFIFQHISTLKTLFSGI